MPEWNGVVAALVLLLAAVSQAAEYAAPAGIRPATRRPGAASILPGGRIITPAGIQYITGPGPFAIAASPSGKTIVSANRGPDRFSLTILERDKNGQRLVRHIVSNGESEEWRGVATGVAFDGEHTVYVSEGASGRIWAANPSDGSRKRPLELDQDGSSTAELAFDPERKLLYALDPAHSRLVALDVNKRKVSASLPFTSSPRALSLSPDHKRAYVLTRSLEIVNLENASTPAVAASILPESNLSAALATADRVFVADAMDDSITVIDAKTNQVIGAVPMRIPGLEDLRGLEPTALAYHQQTGWLLVAEAGANAVGIVDTKQMKLIGHIPVGWTPARILVDADTVYVTNAKGQGLGPNVGPLPHDESFSNTLGRGSVTAFPIPSEKELADMTAKVMAANGYTPKLSEGAAPIPEAIRHVVLILKGNRTFDDILGDIREASNGAVMGSPALARHGRNGYADGRNVRLSLQRVNTTPNHHQLARSFSFSDNFYADTGSSFGLRWPHIERQGISVLNMAGADEANTPDQERATRFIQTLQEKYGEGKAPLPNLILLRLPNDHLGEPRPDDGYPYGASYVADNDVALGRVIEFLSNSPWWREMAVFIAEGAALGGLDHIDPHRTILLNVGPYAKRNYVSRVNSSFPGLLKTIFRILRLPPVTLFDATASDLAEMFTDTPDYTPFAALPADKRVFDPAKIKPAAGAP